MRFGAGIEGAAIAATRSTAEAEAGLLEASCYSCPNCGRLPHLSRGCTEETRRILSCGHAGCDLPAVTAVAAPTLEQAIALWNREALDLGDQLAEAPMDVRALRPRSDREQGAHRALCSLGALSPVEAWHAVDLLESAGSLVDVRQVLWLAGVKAGEWALVAHALGYATGATEPPAVQCWECRRPIGRREHRGILRNESGLHWICPDHGSRR